MANELSIPGEEDSFPVISGRFALTRPLAPLGRGVTYECRDRNRADEFVALTLFTAHELPALADPQFRPRLHETCAIGRTLVHPAIRQIYDFGELHDGRFYISSPITTGDSLSQLLQRGRQLGIHEVVHLITWMADALAFAHAGDMIHGCLRPSCIAVDEAGGPQIAEFGLTPLNAFRTVSSPCLEVEDAAFQSPEQLLGFSPTERSDIYSLGLIAYSLTTGSAPFTAEQLLDTALAVTGSPLPDFPKSPARPPLWFQEFVRKACAKHPEARFGSAKEVVDLFWMHSPSEAERTGHSQLPFVLKPNS